MSTFCLDTIVKTFWELDELLMRLNSIPFYEFQVKMIHTGAELVKLFPLMDYFVLTRNTGIYTEITLEKVQEQWENLLKQTSENLSAVKRILASSQIEPVSCLCRLLVSTGFSKAPLPRASYQVLALFESIFTQVETGYRQFSSMTYEKFEEDVVSNLKIVNKNFMDKSRQKKTLAKETLITIAENNPKFAFLKMIS